MSSEAYIEALSEAFTLDALKEARDAVALNLASQAANSVEVNLKRVDGTETSGIVVATYDQKIAFLTAVKQAIDRKEGKPQRPTGLKTDFSKQFLDP